MKKLISTLISFTIAFSALTAFAENNTDEMQEILVSVKDRIGDTQKYSEFNSSSRKINDETVYRFEWSNSSENGWSYMNVDCNSDGVITSYDIYDSEQKHSDSGLSINRTKKADALKAAQEAVNRLNPQIADKIVVSDTSEYEDFRSDNFNFRLQRYENGIPVMSDIGWINLNSKCEMQSFNISYTTGLSFENTDNTISQNDAAKAYNEGIGTKLFYITKYENNAKEPSVKLVYSPADSNDYVNAATGEIIHIEPYYNFYNTSKDAAANESASLSGGGGNAQRALTEAEKKNLEEIEGLISSETADKTVRDCSYFKIDSSYKLNSSSLYYVQSTKTYIYSLFYNTEDNGSASASVNAKTGEIISFSKDTKNAAYPDEQKTDKEQIAQLAENVINDLAGEKASEYALETKNETASNSIFYVRYVNAIPFYENSISISFDNEYNLISYNISYYDAAFPAPENIISDEQAFDIMKDLGEYKIYYKADYKNKKFVPVYDFTSSCTIDAFTGKTIYENTASQKGGQYTDIEGHYAEKQIKTLSEYGIFFDGTELNPDAPVTQKEYAALLSVVFYHNDISCLRNSYSAESLYKTLPQNFLADDIDPDAHLTRSDAAVLMIRAMGIEEYAKLSNIYAPLYSDVSENIGYINILTGLGVVSGDGSGNFNPNAEITRAQSLIMIYNYLSR